MALGIFNIGAVCAEETSTITAYITVSKYGEIVNDKDGNIQLCNVPSEYKETVDKMENGTIILIYDAYVVVCRKGKGTLALMIPKLINESVKKYILETIALNKEK